MKKVKLNITKSNIKNGTIADPSNCPIANSIKDKVRGLIYVSVLADYAFVGIKRGKKTAQYKAPLAKEANTFVKSFDRGNNVKPFNFELVLNKLNTI